MPCTQAGTGRAALFAPPEEALALLDGLGQTLLDGLGQTLLGGDV